MEDLTLRQLESLAIDYFECRLSRVEEADLRKALLLSPHTSALLDECRLAMGLEATIRRSIPAADTPRKEPRPRRSPLAWLSVAASVAVVITAGSFFASRHHSTPATEYYAEVYVNGRQITDSHEAAAIAERNRAALLARKDSLLRYFMGEQARSLADMNRLLDKVQTTASNR